MCLALTYLHENNVVHFDIKPSNFLRDSHRTLLLSDFGLANLIGQFDKKTGLIRVDGALVKSSMRAGTIHYMAPECINGQPGRRSDLYSVGVVLYKMLTGTVPFNGSSPEEILYKIFKQPPPVLSEARSSLPRDIDNVIRKAMAKDPRDRYKAAGELYAAFNDAVSGKDDW